MFVSFMIKLSSIHLGLLPCSSQLPLRVPDLLLSPGGVLQLLLLEELGRGVDGLTGGIQWTGVTVGPSLSASLVTSSQHPTLTISSEGSQRTNLLSRGSNQTSVNVDVFSVHCDNLASSDVNNFARRDKLGCAGNKGSYSTTDLEHVRLMGSREDFLEIITNTSFSMLPV